MTLCCERWDDTLLCFLLPTLSLIPFFNAYKTFYLARLLTITLCSVTVVLLVIQSLFFLKMDPVLISGSFTILNSFLKNIYLGLPWWRSGWESACQCREHGFEPWSGKIPHATEQLGPWAIITEPARLEPVLRNKRGHNSERPAHCDEEWPPLATTRESPRTETKTQHAINK